MRQRVVLPGRQLSDGKIESAIGTLVCLAMAVGLSQNVIYSYVNVELVNYLDDALVLFAFLLATLRIGRVRALGALLLALWFIFLGLALVRSPVESGLAFAELASLFRQVVMPAIVIVIGLVLSRLEWRRIVKFTIGLGLVNAFYGIFEIVVTRPIDPAIRAVNSGEYLYPNGLPGHYQGFLLDGSSMIRLGGLYLNPPTTGILLATCAVLAFYTVRGRSRKLITLLLVCTTLLTLSRAGMLILVVGTVVPYLAKKLGGYFVLILLGAAAVPVALNVMTHGGSGKHLDGALYGFTDGLTSIIGRGFGFVGNSTSGLGTTEASESLLGIAMSAGGVPVIFLAVVFISFQLRRIVSVPTDWISSLALGALLAAVFSESAGAMNATIPLWLAAGYSLVPYSRRATRLLPKKAHAATAVNDH